jgi:probable O-glycosylation ligase (exosortase A-associated)
MRDYLVLALVLATIPLALYRPFFGLLGFSWLAYMRPQDLSWGLAAELPLSKYVAVALWLGLIMRGKLNVFRRTPITLAMVALWAWLGVTCFTAVHSDVAWAKLEDISKVMLIAMITVVVVTDRSRFRMTMAVIGISLGFLGLKYGVYGVLRGGVRFTRGVGGMIGDNNDFALALNLALPVLVYLSWDLEKKWLRLLCLGLAVMNGVTVIFTHSRGGFLSLAALTLYLILQSRRKFMALGLVLALGIGGSFVVPQSFYERMGSIANFREDGSAMGRLNAWQASIAMANDFPVFGVGLDNFLFEFLYYAPDPEDMHVAHNTWFQVLAETGYTGLALYLGLFGCTAWTLWRAQRRARRYRIVWAANAAKCLSASILAFVVGGTFLNRAHFDLIYHLMAMCACLDRLLTWEIQAQRRVEPSRLERAA